MENITFVYKSHKELFRKTTHVQTVCKTQLWTLLGQKLKKYLLNFYQIKSITVFYVLKTLFKLNKTKEKLHFIPLSIHSFLLLSPKFNMWHFTPQTFKLWQFNHFDLFFPKMPLSHILF